MVDGTKNGTRCLRVSPFKCWRVFGDGDELEYPSLFTNLAGEHNLRLIAVSIWRPYEDDESDDFQAKRKTDTFTMFMCIIIKWTCPPKHNFTFKWNYSSNFGCRSFATCSLSEFKLEKMHHADQTKIWKIWNVCRKSKSTS